MADSDSKKPLDIEDHSEEKGGSTGVGLGLCFGCAFGLLAQILTGEVMWLSLAVAVGFGLGFAIGDTTKKKKGR